MKNTICVHESEIPPEHHPDRWSKDLIGGPQVPTQAGFSLGVAEYHAAQFGELQVHPDQEEVYFISGVGQIRIGDQVFDVKPGSMFRLAPGTRHATRRTGPESVRVVYAHANPELPPTIKSGAGISIHDNAELPPTLKSAMGISAHDKAEFGAAKAHDDNEALYVLSGVGQIQVGDQALDVRPGCAVYVPPHIPHATRTTRPEPIRTLFAHGAA